MKFELRLELYDVGDPITHVYFPIQGVVSIVKDLEDGNIVEVSTVGCEGFVSINVLLGSFTATSRTLVQIPGAGFRMKARAFSELLDEAPKLREVGMRYTLALMNQIAQSAACNRMHDVDARCARWLLMTHDRVGADSFPLTQEFLAQMLGVHRPTVSLTAQMLQRAGLISYVRGIITITDRAGLEAASCDCYAAIRREYDKIA